jgi:ubiquinone/menaquinone biosynthesis C-methylase UbiE
MDQKTVWNKIARKWDEMRKTPFEQDLDFIKKQEGKMLDLGCGSGRNFYKKEGLEIYATDFSQKMLDFSKETGIAKEIKLMEKESIPYENEFFDSAVCIAVLHCVESEKQRKKLIKELYRVLKNNTKALVTVWGKNQERIKNKPKETFVPWTVGDKKYDRYTYIYDKEELESQLKEAGFKIEKFWEDVNLNFMVSKE